MEPPRLPPVVAGRSALPAFLELEAWARKQTDEARTRAETSLDGARSEAARVRSEGERALRDAVVDAEREAVREVESRVRDGISEARHAVEAWVNEAEETASGAIEEALDLVCGAAPLEDEPGGEAQED